MFLLLSDQSSTLSSTPNANMGRNACSKTQGLRKGSWTSEEDQKLVSYIQQHGQGNWHSLAHKAGLLRCGKSCRLRWSNYLRPNIKRGGFSAEEDQTIIQLHAIYGNRWSTIAQSLVRRTDNEIKNYWNTKLKKRVTKHKTANIIPNNAQNSNECHQYFNYTSEARLNEVSTTTSKSLLSKVTNKQILNQIASKVSLIINGGKAIMETQETLVKGSANGISSVHDLVNTDIDDHGYIELPNSLNRFDFIMDSSVADLEASINWYDYVFHEF